MLIQAPPGLLQGAFETTQNRAIQYMLTLVWTFGPRCEPKPEAFGHFRLRQGVACGLALLAVL